MRCSACKKEISGYAEMGSAAYQRVSRGCCPHCGASLSGGVRVGFSSGGASRPGQTELTMLRAGYDQRAVAVLLAMLVSLWGLWTDGAAAFGPGALVIVLSLADILIGGIVFLYAFVIGRPNSMLAFMLEGLINTKKRPSAVFGGLKLLIDFLFLLIMFSAHIKTGDFEWSAARMGIAALLALWYGIAPKLAIPRRRR